jgi:hypothetical protein
VALVIEVSKSFASRRFRLSQARVRSTTTHRRGSIPVGACDDFDCPVAKFGQSLVQIGAVIGAVQRDGATRETGVDGFGNPGPIAIQDVGGMDHGTHDMGACDLLPSCDRISPRPSLSMVDRSKAAFPLFLWVFLQQNSPRNINWKSPPLVEFFPAQPLTWFSFFQKGRRRNDRGVF